MKMTRMEAALYRDYGKYSDDYPYTEVLVLDLDLGETGLYRMKADGTFAAIGTEQLGEVHNGDVLLEGLSKQAGVTREELLDSWKEQAEAANLQIKRCMRMRNVGSQSVLTVRRKDALQSSAVITCSSLVQFFAEVRNSIRQQLAQAQALLEQKQVSEDTLRILPLGWIAGLYPAEHMVREQFSFDVFLPDQRFGVFAEGADVERVCREALEWYDQTHTAGYDAAFIYYTGDEFTVCRREVHMLVQKNDPSSSVNEKVHWGPVYAVTQEPLDLTVNGREAAVKIPDSFLKEGEGYVELAFRLDGRRPVLSVRREDGETFRAYLDEGEEET